MADNDFDGIKYREEQGSPLIFRLLLGGLVVWGVLFMGYYLFSGWSSEKEFAEKKKLADARAAENEKKENVPTPGGGLVHKEGDAAAYLAAGKKLFGERCAACHGPEAKGGIGPDLTKAEFKFGKSEAAITESIGNGRPGGMPGFGKELGHEQLEGVIKYILSLK
jgi:cytochrome c oxidase cbb3-type subunit 3